MHKALTNINLDKLPKYAVALAYSSDCPNCEPALEHFPEKFEGVPLYLIDYDVEVELCDEIFEIPMVPTYIFFYNGEQQGTMWGLQEPTTVEGFIWSNLRRAKRKEEKKLGIYKGDLEPLSEGYEGREIHEYKGTVAER